MGQQREIYFQAALERISEARYLHMNGYYVLAMYASGLAVECLLRAFRLFKDTSFDERHDLWLLWRSTDLANVHSEFYHEGIHSSLGIVTLLWRNDYRFDSESAVRAYLKKAGRNRGIKGDFLKYNSQRLFKAAADIIRLGTQKWLLLNKR